MSVLSPLLLLSFFLWLRFSGCRGLRVLLVPVLAGIMEADQDRCWGFDQFFKATTDLLQRQPVHLFSLQQAAAHCIYVHHYNTVSVFFEEVASQTGIGIQQQHLMYLGHELPLEGSMKVVNLPSTSSSQPLILLCYAPEPNTILPFREPETPVIPSKFDVVADYNFSKVIVGVVHQYLRIVRLLHTHTELLLQGYHSYMMKLRGDCREAMHSITLITLRLQACFNAQHRIHKLTSYSSDNQGSVDISQKLKQLHEILPVYTAGIQEFQNQLDHMQIEQAKLAEALASDKSCPKMEMLLQKITAIHQHYRKDRVTGKLLYNDEQIHKFEKIHLSSHIKRVKSLFREECMQRYKELLVSAKTWSSVMLEMQTRLLDFGSFSTGLLADLEMNEQHQNKAMDRMLYSLQTNRAEQPGLTPRDKDQMVSRMHHLREEMGLLVRELQCNNSIIESLGAVSSAADPARPCTM